MKSLAGMRRLAVLLAVGTLLLAGQVQRVQAYSGPQLVVTAWSNGTGSATTRNLDRAIDADPTTYAQIGYDGGYAVYSYADGVPRLVSGLTYKASNFANGTATVELIDGMGQVVYSASMVQGEQTLTFGPVEVLRYRFIDYGKNYLLLHDFQPTVLEVEAPGEPEGFAVVEVRSSRVQLQWSAPTTGGPVSGYRVYRDGLLLDTVTGTGYSDTQVTPGATYSYQLTAYGPGGESSLAGPVLVTVPEPSDDRPGPPANLSVTPKDYSLEVSWSPSSYGDVAGYRIYLDGGLVAEVQGTSYTLVDLTPGQEYVVGVSAVDTQGNESEQITATGVPLAPPTPPGQPRSLAFRVVPGSVTLQWAPPADGGQVESYRVYRNEDLIGTTATTTWTDTEVLPDQVYLYAVTALNSAGESPRTEVTVRTVRPGLLDGVTSNLTGLAGAVQDGLRILLPVFVVAAGLLLGRLVLGQGMQWLEAGRRWRGWTGRWPTMGR